jgi:hypothetical protein
MRKTLIALTATVPLALLAPWTAKANPPASVQRPPTQSYLKEQIGCKGGPSREDRCPYGYRIVGEGKGRCVPCGQQSYGRDRKDRYEEPRRYREYGDYGSRRYRQYEDEQNYEPRRYPREYY